jgi:hypothetical protein
MIALDFVVGRWNESPFDFFITAGMPLLVLGVAWVACLLRRTRLPMVFYPTAFLCSIASVFFSPNCMCMGTEQTIGTAVIALLVSTIFFGPVALGCALLSRSRAS